MNFTKADALSLVKLDAQELDNLLSTLNLNEPFTIEDIELILAAAKGGCERSTPKVPNNLATPSGSPEPQDTAPIQEPKNSTVEPNTAYLIEQLQEKDKQIEKLLALVEQLNQSNQALITSNHLLSAHNQEPTEVEQPTYEVPQQPEPHVSKLRRMLNILFS